MADAMELVVDMASNACAIRSVVYVIAESLEYLRRLSAASRAVWLMVLRCLLLTAAVVVMQGQIVVVTITPGMLMPAVVSWPCHVASPSSSSHSQRRTRGSKPRYGH